MLQAALQDIPPGRYGPAWLQATAPLLASGDGETPATTALDNRDLNSWLGGWLLLHHETELVPRPVDWTATEAATLPGFVEAQPQLLAALAALARQVEEGLRERDLLDAEVGQKLLQLERLYRALQDVAEADLAGEPLDDDSRLLLRQLAPRLEALLTFAPPAGGVPLVDVALARQATMYADPSSGFKLVAGMGPAWPLYAVVGRDGEQWLAAGGIFTTFELRQAAGAVEAPAPETVPPAPWLQAMLEP
jgi:hypothetical protein